MGVQRLVFGVMLIASILISRNLLADLLYAWLDPRVRLGSKGADR